MGSLKPYVLLALMTIPALSNDLIPDNAHKSFTIVVSPSQTGGVDSVAYLSIENKKKWDGEGMWGYEIAVNGVNKRPNGDSEKLPERKYSLTCGIYSEGEDKNTVYPSSADVSENGSGAMVSAVDPELIETGAAYDFFAHNNYFYDMWWAACTNINQKFTLKTLDTLRQMPVAAASPSLKATNSNLLHKDAEKAFTVFPEITMNMKEMISVTYGFIVEVKKFQEEDTVGFHVTTKTVTKHADGKTTKLPYPNYPHKNKYLIFCLGDAAVTEHYEDGEFVNEVINFVDKDDIKARMGPSPFNPASFYYDLWFAVCEKQNRVSTDSFYLEFKKSKR